jgi:hypothetical protein
MSEAIENTEAEAVETAAPEADAGAPQQDATPSYEDQALKMGWTPQAQFKGDPEKWVDAETFVKRGEEMLPFLKANNRRLEQALERASTKIEQMEKGLKSAIQQLSKADQRAYAKAKADLEAELAQFAAAGDVDNVKAVTQDIIALEKETAGKADDDKPAEEDQDFAAWRAENPWFGKDRALTAAASAIGEEVAEEGYSGKAQIKEVDRRLREAFPEKFAKPTNPNRNAPAAVEGQGAPIRPRGKTFADLPPDAKAMCDELCRDIKGFTREKYVREFFKEDKQ